MRPFRSLLGLILMVLMLPWGAYVGASPLVDGRAPLSSQAAASERPDAWAAAMSDRPELRRAGWKCRVLTPPASPCGPDRVVLAEDAAIVPAVVRARRASPADWPWRDAPPLAIESPPRSR